MAKNIMIGDYRHPIAVMGLTNVKDPNNGSITPTYTLKYNLLADKVDYVPKRGAKEVVNDILANKDTISFTCHYRDINETDRIVYNTNTYEIVMLGEIGYKEGLTIICKKLIGV
jgi:hypothetical protein